ncbi:MULTISPECIES: hypothetical protein [unclassified Burkholderia]|uniref:hypothetical protein n=1 Tax=unclassified Burkholderia TaxID=2613784 RepID=UPI0015896EF7|nr:MULTISPECIES: hypothetical protein [unclassified Burkholderia]
MVSIDFKKMAPSSGSVGRVLIVHTYDGNGNVLVKRPSGVFLNGVVTAWGWQDNPPGGRSYGYGQSEDWVNTEPFIGVASVRMDNSKIADWPAIGIMAAQSFSDGYPGYYENTGSVYIRVGETGGACTVVNPNSPQPLDIAVNVTAPDWNLGELPRGESEKSFPEIANQLCFTYSGPKVKGKNFVINASDANGVVANRYRLKNVADASQLIPYDITLDSGTSALSLPNASNAALPFDSSGKTCFVPTFKTTVDAKVKEGDYSDVLTFTVVVKP